MQCIFMVVLGLMLLTCHCGAAGKKRTYGTKATKPPTTTVAIVRTTTTPATTTTLKPTKPPDRVCGFGIDELCVKFWECTPTKNQTDERIGSDSTIKISLNIRRVCHYLEVCCKSEDIDKIPNPYTGRAMQTKYGASNPDGVYMTIMDANDNEANFGEYPWTVAIFSNNSDKLSCLGALIHYKVVLTTAAHVSNPDAKFIARAGEWDLETTNELLPYVEIGVKTTIRHENFSIVNLDYNIAILILENSFEPRDYIRPICIPAMEPRKTKCATSAWRAYADNGQHILKERMMFVQPSKGNSTVFKAFGEQSNSGLTYAVGAPLVCPKERSLFSVNAQLLIGLWSKDSGDKRTPAEFIDVVKFKSWIQRKLANQKITLKKKC